MLEGVNSFKGAFKGIPTFENHCLEEKLTFGDPFLPREALRGGIPASLLEPFLGHLSPKIDKVS